LKVDGNLLMEDNTASGFEGVVNVDTGTDVAGNILVQNNVLTDGGLVQVQNAEAHGNVLLNSNEVAGSSGLHVIKALGDKVGGNLEVSNNLLEPYGEPEVADNTVEANLQCQNNKPPPFGGGNTANKKLGQREHL
jgi:hypothetical protein